jgi:hypothetical protein
VVQFHEQASSFDSAQRQNAFSGWNFALFCVIQSSGADNVQDSCTLQETQHDVCIKNGAQQQGSLTG